jgi:hypothetical protein
MDGAAAAQKRMKVFWFFFSKKEQRFCLKPEARRKEAKTSDVFVRCR